MLKPSDFNNAVPQFPNGSYASNPINPQYIAEPDAENYNKGTEPLQTLPAQWWNWFLNKFTSRFNKINIYVKNIFNELAQVLSIFNITPDGTEQTPTTSQLKTVFESCYPQYVKTAASLVGTEITVNGHPLSSNVTVTRSDLGLGTSATVNTGTEVGCIPTVGTALGTTNNNILVTDSTGKLKPSGITVGTAAGCAATFFAKKTELDALYGNIAGTALGTAAVGTCTTFARSDHVHPMPTTVACANYLYSTSDTGIYSDTHGNFRHKDNQVTSYWHIDRYDGTPIFSVYFEEGYVCAPVFCGCLSGNATSATRACYACQAVGIIPFDAAETVNPVGTVARAIAMKATTKGIGFRTRIAIGLSHNKSGWAHGVISVGCDDNGTKWEDFIFPVGHGGNVVTSSTIGSCTAGCATTSSYLRAVNEHGICTDACGNFFHMTDSISDSWDVLNHAGDSIFSVFFEQNYVRACCFCGNATSAGVTCTFGLAVGRRNETMRQWSTTWDDGALQCDIYKAICWAMNGGTGFVSMGIFGSTGSHWSAPQEDQTNVVCSLTFLGDFYRVTHRSGISQDFYATCTCGYSLGCIGGIY